MNKKERAARRARITSEEVPDFYKKERVVNVHGDNYRHFMVKAATFKILQEAGHKVATEVTFKNGKIADVLDLTSFEVIEVETGASRADIEGKLDDFREFDLDDIKVFDPTELPKALDELKTELEARLHTEV